MRSPQFPPPRRAGFTLKDALIVIAVVAVVVVVAVPVIVALTRRDPLVAAVANSATTWCVARVAGDSGSSAINETAVPRDARPLAVAFERVFRRRVEFRVRALEAGVVCEYRICYFGRMSGSTSEQRNCTNWQPA